MHDTSEQMIHDVIDLNPHATWLKAPHLLQDNRGGDYQSILSHLELKRSHACLEPHLNESIKLTSILTKKLAKCSFRKRSCF